MRPHTPPPASQLKLEQHRSGNTNFSEFQAEFAADRQDRLPERCCVRGDRPSDALQDPRVVFRIRLALRCNRCPKSHAIPLPPGEELVLYSFYFHRSRAKQEESFWRTPSLRGVARRGSPAVVLSKAGPRLCGQLWYGSSIARMTRLRRKPAKVTLLALLTVDFDCELVARPQIPTRPMDSN